MHLGNALMQLRKVCSHPFLFEWPEDPATRQPILNDELVAASGKMMLLFPHQHHIVPRRRCSTLK